ncbi:hypothetical protein TNCV_3882541 [Trichonephila clavipes]|nr:hypothetical protein TNCV_3882541 [Trichonephila clavipes]
MILHIPTENSLAVLNHKILEPNSQVQNVKLLDIMTVQFWNEKVSNHGPHQSPLTVTLWPSSFLKKYGPMIPPAIKRIKQSPFLDVTVFRHTLVD